MNITLHAWNVGHGEALRIDFGAERAVIRDFGRSHTAQDSPTCVELAQLCDGPFIPTDRPVDAVLSHAHSDHYNGFAALYAQHGETPIFEQAFIPWLNLDALDELGLGMTLIGAYTYAYTGPDRAPGRRAENWVLAAPVLAALSKALIGVGAGHRFDWTDDAHCLWPPPPGRGRGFWAQATRQTRAVLTSLRTIVRAEDRAQEGTLIELIAETQWDLLRAYHRPDPDRPTGAGRGPDGRRISEDLAALRDTFDQLAAIRPPRSARMDRAIARAASSHRNNLDNQSIVFEVDKKLLVLSDLEAAKMNAMARAYIREPRHYKLIKSAHHGTRLGSTDFARLARGPDRVLHCCGNAHPNYKGPSAAYSTLLAPAEIICTDHHDRAEALPPGQAQRTMTCSPETFVL